MPHRPPAGTVYFAIRFFSLIILFCPLSRGQVNILTANGDNDRTNANLQEVWLAPATVTPATFGKLGAFRVDGQVYSQVLYVSGLSISGRAAQNVVFVATMHNSVYAFNADSMSPAMLLWHVNLGPSILSSQFIRYNDISVEVGILSTPVIDLQRSVLYVVSETIRQGSPVFTIHALDLASGEERMNGPVVITAAVPGTGSGTPATGTVRFDPWQHLQRPALLLANDAVHVGFGSHGDQSPWHGWLMSYDASDLTRQIGVFMSTPSGDGGAIWQSGRGPAADDRGNVYIVTGNGDFDGIQNFGQSFLKLAGTAPARTGSFTPFDWKSMSDNDADVSAGPALIPGTRTVIGADKNGNLYVLDSDAMEQGGSEFFNKAQHVFEVSRGSIFNLAVWSRPGNPYIYLQGQREPVQCFQLAADLTPSPVSATSATATFGRIGMTISANGGRNDTGILWQTTGNYNDASAPGALHAFDASNLAIELWNSDMNPARDGMGNVAKFVGPTVANGKVYVPTFSNTVVVYGLLPVEGNEDPQPVITSVENAAGYSQDAISPGELVAIFGSSLGPEISAGMQFDAFGLVSTKLADTVALFDGIPGPMAYASASQVNAIAPFGLSSRSAQVQVGYQGRLSDPFSIAVAPSSPGIFALDGSGSGQGLIINPDGTLNSADNPASVGTVIILYATGAGLLSPSGQDGAVVAADSLPRVILPVSAELGGQPAEVLYAGRGPGIVEGIIQVNLRIPNGAPTGPSVPIALQIGDRTSQSGLSVALATGGGPTEPGSPGSK